MFSGAQECNIEESPAPPVDQQVRKVFRPDTPGTDVVEDVLIPMNQQEVLARSVTETTVRGKGMVFMNASCCYFERKPIQLF